MNYDIWLREEIIEDGEQVDLEWSCIREHVQESIVTDFLNLRKPIAYQYYITEVYFDERYKEWRDTDEDGINGEYWLELKGGAK